VPVFGICYGFQAMAQALGGTVAHTGTSEYGRTELNVTGGQLHSDLPTTQPVWMSHGDAVTAAPEGFDVVAVSAGAPVAAFEDRARRLAGVQYHPEVLHTPYGQQVLNRFLHEFAGIGATWTPANIADALVEQVRNQIGDGRAICGLSGGVDSAVAAALVQRAIGDRLTCVFVDHGLLRAGERAQVQRDFVAATGANLVTVDVADRFLQALSGVTGPEGKRKIIGREFIRAFEGAVRDVLGNSDTGDSEVEFLVQGTLYPDVVESGGGTGTANIKSHHNVGGLPGDLKFKLVEPARGNRCAPTVPGPRPWHPDRRRGHRSAPGHTAPSRRDRPRGTVRCRAGQPDLAVPGGAAGRRPVSWGAGRRPHLRPPDRAASGVQ
jgi:GMP synthase (glutamine-hydrolysing)